jgi:hypothetical protein
MPKGHPRSSTQTLLKVLAKEAKSERVRLRACELLLEIEGKGISPGKPLADRKQEPGKSSDSEGQTLAKLLSKTKANHL